MPEITDVSDNSFQAEVLENDTPVLVDFWAPWCGPWRVVAPALEELADSRDDLRIVKLNVDDNQQTAAQYQVLAIPTMILFRNGQEAKRIQGAMPKKRIEAELEPALAAERRRRCTSAAARRDREHAAVMPAAQARLTAMCSGRPSIVTASAAV